MQNSSPIRPNLKSDYYNPITKIRSLIQGLDAELLQLCSQCTVPKTLQLGASNHSNIKNSGSSRAVRSIGSMLVTSKNPSSDVQTRTLSSIYRSKVIDAYRNRRIFTVYGNYHTIRRALVRRGWLEKLPSSRYPKLQGLAEDVLLQHAKRGNEFEAVAISKIINHFPSFFIWQPKGQRDICADVRPYRNRVRRSRRLDFSTKVGLIGCAEQENWYHQPGVCGMNYPRFYRLGGNFEERAVLKKDFYKTQCRSLLKYLRDNMETPEEIIDEEQGTVLISVVNFALLNVKTQLGEMENFTLDDNGIANAQNDTAEWQNFMYNSNEILQKKAKLKTNLKELLEIIKYSTVMINKIEEKHLDYKWDGYRNLWILKPGYQSRGNGIIIRNSLDDILQWANNNPQRSYIAQKYIERPYLIYKTKFDIRQYMLLSIGETMLSIWLYKDCYLRFSSQEFTIDDLRESIHLTNNSVQKRYKNKITRDARLPKQNMWSLEQFKLYLKHHNAPDDVWNNKIYAGFRENLVGVVMASLEETEFIENAFELYGCDFMLDEEYNPILIEINSTPDLSASTEVTAQICPLVLKDLLKVIVDLPRNSRSPTGMFELVYEVNYKIKKEFDPQVGLDVNGKAMTLFKPIEPKPKFFRKPMRILKRTEAIIKAPLKRFKKKSEDKQLKIKSQEDSSINGAENKTLKPVAKEALAVRYTLPK